MTETEVNAMVGVYKAAQTFAFLPYQLLLSVTFVVFPIVNRATLEGTKTPRGASSRARCASARWRSARWCRCLWACRAGC